MSIFGIFDSFQTALNSMEICIIIHLYLTSATNCVCLVGSTKGMRSSILMPVFSGVPFI